MYVENNTDQLNIKQDISFKDSDIYLVEFIDGLTPGAIEENMKHMKRKVSNSVESICNKAINEFKWKYGKEN